MSPAAITFASIADHGLAASAEVLTSGFKGYFVPIVFTSSSLLGMVRCDSVDATLSCVALADGEPVGAALVARRGWTARVAAMGIVAAARRRGVARAIMGHVLGAAKARGDRAVELEVIDQNTPAIALYEDLGFKPLRRLVGYEGGVTVNATAAPPLEPMDIVELARLVTVHGLDDLPWQLSGPTLAQQGSPNVALRCGPSAVLVSDPSAPTITIRALVSERAARQRGHALALLDALFARHPDKQWRVNPLWPEETARIFGKVGLVPTALRQWHMRAGVT